MRHLRFPMSIYMLNNAEIAIPPAAHRLIAYVTGGLVAWFLVGRGVCQPPRVPHPEPDHL